MRNKRLVLKTETEITLLIFFIIDASYHLKFGRFALNRKNYLEFEIFILTVLNSSFYILLSFEVGFKPNKMVVPPLNQLF